MNVHNNGITKILIAALFTVAKNTELQMTNNRIRLEYTSFSITDATTENNDEEVYLSIW